jgi:hypothetical protein
MPPLPVPPHSTTSTAKRVSGVIASFGTSTWKLVSRSSSAEALLIVGFSSE